MPNKLPSPSGFRRPPPVTFKGNGGGGGFKFSVWILCGNTPWGVEEGGNGSRGRTQAFCVDTVDRHEPIRFRFHGAHTFCQLYGRCGKVAVRTYSKIC